MQQVMCMYCEINANLYNWRSTAVVRCSFRAQGGGPEPGPCSDASNMISEVCITDRGSGQASQANNKHGRDDFFSFLFITQSIITILELMKHSKCPSFYPKRNRSSVYKSMIMCIAVVTLAGWLQY